MGIKMLNFLETEGIRTDTRCQRWVSGAVEEPQKGGHQSGTYLYTSDM